MHFTIRHTQVKDAHAIAEAERQIAQEPGFFCSQPFELSDENVANTISSFLKDKKGIYLVAEQEGQLIGHAFLEPHALHALSHVADLNIAVHLGWHGKGIGKKLLEQIIEWAKNSPALEKIQLNVRASNLVAISLYKKMGFQEEGRLKNRLKIKDHYIDDLIMGLELKKNKRKSFLIRPLDQTDIPKIVRRYSFPWSSPEKTKVLWDTYYQEQQDGIRTVAMLEANHEILGYGSLLRKPESPFFAQENVPEINAIWIDENHRRQGLGTALIKWIEDLARQENYHQIGIGIGLYKDYGPAQQLYFQLGYIPDGNGITYKGQAIIPGQSYPLDDDLILWLRKALS